MDRKMELDCLAVAEKAIALGGRHIAREEQMISELDRAGRDTKLAFAVLATYRQAQAEHVAHRNLILNRLQLLQQHQTARAAMVRAKATGYIARRRTEPMRFRDAAGMS